ncbi:carbohydrate ABC transporter permease [Cutibacterium sp.]|uniref:carbohydrate ABC transporter permease n=1 Tax=Cutibacterium sp. TaxID=1912221 RepID=UPI0026DD7012|nr:sugar ABC transporter permease [Cutibacterium sp.]MDO4412597.1 sugar ABC transporter permease [Cutibacterium sp.]
MTDDIHAATSGSPDEPASHHDPSPARAAVTEQATSSSVAPTSNVAPHRTRKSHGHARRRWFVSLCVAPATILFLIVLVYPTIKVFWMSFFQRTAYSDTQTFVGLSNFQKLFHDPNFVRSFQNTILLLVVVTIVTFAFALVFAAILSREKVKGDSFFRVIFYIPNILSIVVVSAIFSAIYKPENGLLNTILSLFKGEPVQIMWKSERLVILALIIAMVWQAIGYYMVMYMASISSVPESIYESASLDGASNFKQFFTITIPMIWTNIRTTLTFFIISTINMAFLFVTAMTGGGPNGASEVVLTYMYTQAYTNASYGYGMAIGVMVFLFSFILAALVNKVTERDVLEF